MDSTVVFAHERLLAYQRACAFVTVVAGILRGLPRGEAHLADQLRRAGDSVLHNLAEGAGRTAGADKARYDDIARGSGTECAAALDVCAIRSLALAGEIEHARRLLHEVVCLLTALARGGRQLIVELALPQPGWSYAPALWVVTAPPTGAWTIAACSLAGCMSLAWWRGDATRRSRIEYAVALGWMGAVAFLAWAVTGLDPGLILSMDGGPAPK